MISPRVTPVALLLLLLLSTACGGGSASPRPGPGAAAVSLAFTVEPGPSSAVAPLSPVVMVELRDAAGRRVPEATSPVTLALAPDGGPAVLGGTTTREAVGGVASFTDLQVTRAGAGYRLVASSAGLTAATSAPFTVSAGPAAAVVLVGQPGDGRTGTPLVPALAVSVRDAAGNAVEDGAVQVAVTLVPGEGGGPLTGTAVTGTVGGVASFPDLAVGGAGAHTLRATVAGGGPSVTTAPFQLTDAWVAIGPDGGAMAVAADPGSPLAALAGGERRAGLWRTVDGGATWVSIAALRGHTLTPVFEEPGVAWAHGDSLWRSTDGGVTWVESPGFGLSTDGTISGVARDAVTGTTYVAVSDYESRLLATSDDGATFAPVAPALPGGAWLLEVAAGPGGVHVLTSQGFQTLARGALDWTAPVAVDTNPYRLLAHPTDPLVLFAAGLFGLHRSTDGGATWVAVEQRGYRDVWIDPADPATVVGVRSSFGLDVSSDGGATFPTAVDLPDREGLSLSGTASSLYLGTGDGPLRSTDGGATWEAATGGLRAGRVTAVAVSAGTPRVVLAGTDQGAVWRSVDGGDTWTKVPSASGVQGASQLFFDPADPARAYYVNGSLLVSDDAGATWTPRGTAPPGVARVALCRLSPATLWAVDQNGSGVWRSTDAGATWPRVYTRPDPNLILADVACDAADPTVATFTAIDFAPGGARTGLWQTRDTGAAWTKLAEPFRGTQVVAGAEAGSLWALSAYALKRTTDLGLTFTEVTPPMGVSGQSLAVNPTDGARLVVGGAAGDGVWLGTDQGGTWVQSRSGHDLFTTRALAYDPNDGATLFAGTSGGGLLVTTTGGL